MNEASAQAALPKLEAADADLGKLARVQFEMNGKKRINSLGELDEA